MYQLFRASFCMLGQTMNGRKPIKPQHVKNHSGKLLLGRLQPFKDLGNEGCTRTELTGLKRVIFNRLKRVIFNTDM